MGMECIECKKIFQAKHPNTKCCSEFCKKQRKIKYDKARIFSIKNCKECEKDFVPSQTLRSYCSELCSAESKRKRNNDRILKKYYEKRDSMPFAKCVQCNEALDKKTTRKIYCAKCAQARIKERNKRISKSRVHIKKPEYNINRNSMRAQRRLAGLCTECGASVESGTTCNECKQKHNLHSTKANRKKGIKEAGQSRHESIVSLCLKEAFPDLKIRERVWGIVRNPISNQSLQLDFYIEEIKIAIEVDGPMHRFPVYGEERLKAQQTNDAIKDEECKNKGIHLIRISTDSIDENDESWLRMTLSQAIRKA